MKNNPPDHSFSWGSKYIDRHPVMANIVIILVISILCIYVAYLSIALFTKHGRSVKVPSVENISYTEAISKLTEGGLKVDIRDSLYREDVKPGYVIEQFPKANSIVKPGRKIFLYINSVHPKEVILDDDNHPNEFALKGNSYRTAMAKFEEMGFKNVRVVRVLGANDRVVKVLANGKPVHKMQKVPVTASIVLEISDGRLAEIQDSLMNLEYLNTYQENSNSYRSESADTYENNYTPATATSAGAQENEEENQYF